MAHVAIKSLSIVDTEELFKLVQYKNVFIYIYIYIYIM